MTKINFQNPIFIITTISFLSAVIIGMLILLPKFQEIEGIRKIILIKNQEIQQREAYFSRIIEDRKKLEEYQERLLKISSALPDNPELNLVFLLRFLETLSSQAGLTFIEIKPFNILPLDDKPNLEITQLGFQVMGSYDSFKAFLLKLENSARIINVKNISFSSPEEELFIFDFEIEVFNYKEPSVFLEREVEINFETLRSPILDKFELFSITKPFEQEIGKENPFIYFNENNRD